MMKLLFNVADRGDKYEFISANTNELAFAGTTNDIIEVPSWEIYEAIIDMLNEGNKRVFAPKEAPFSLYNIYRLTEELNTLEYKKQSAINIARDTLYNKIINKLAIRHAFRFLMLYNTLVDSGIYITNDNKEDIYNNIIQDPDKSSLVNVYNEYILLMNKLDKYIDYIDKYNKTVDIINSIRVITSEELQIRANIQSLEHVEDLSTLKTDNEYLHENEAIAAIDNIINDFIQTLEE